MRRRDRNNTCTHFWHRSNALTVLSLHKMCRLSSAPDRLSKASALYDGFAMEKALRSAALRSRLFACVQTNESEREGFGAGSDGLPHHTRCQRRNGAREPRFGG